MKKALHYINCMMYLGTTIPYATIIYVAYGMYAQFLLGVTQVVIAVSLLLLKNDYTQTIKLHLKRYWCYTITIITLIILYVTLNIVINEILLITVVFIIPMLIASYFMYITHLIQKQ